MMSIRHEETSRDSLYQDLTDNLEVIYGLWVAGDRKLRFILPVLCAIKLEAFINIAGKFNIKSWDNLERKLGFKDKCEIICEVKGLSFDAKAEPNKSAISVFETRNAIVHPKMKLQQINELISQEEYELRRKQMISISHHLRSELTEDEIKGMKKSAGAFVEYWGDKFVEHADYWLRGGSTGSFTHEGD